MSEWKPLFARLMGERFAQLPDELRQMHGLRGRFRLSGRCHVQGPQGFLARCMARLAGLPARSGEGALSFELHADAGGERWVRHFPGGTMCSTLRDRRGVLTETLGPLRLYMHLQSDDRGLAMQLHGLRLFGLPLPRWLGPRIHARERATPGRLHFDVASAMPLIGPVVSYTGHLELATLEPLS